MIRCDICRKAVFKTDMVVVDYDSLRHVTKLGFIPSYFLERDKDGIEYGIPKERKWYNTVKSWPKDNMEICQECNAEMMEVFDKIK